MGFLIQYLAVFVFLATIVKCRVPGSLNARWPSVLDLPWIPQWVDCDFDWETYDNGPKCYDCSKVLQCTPVGGIVRSCWGNNPYCNGGVCTSLASDGCAVTEPSIEPTNIVTPTEKMAVLQVQHEAVSILSRWRPASMPDLPWIPQWENCEFDWETYYNGPKCCDCSKVLQCTPVGGIVRSCCGDTPYCSGGVCTAVAPDGCAEFEPQITTVTPMADY